MITIVNPAHWLTAEGLIPDDPRIRSKIIRVAQCIEAGGPLARGHSRETLAPCRRRPGRKACLGFLWVLKEVDDSILAFCAVCRADEFLIHDWEDTQWAEGPMEPVDVAAMSVEAGPETRNADRADLDELLGRGLALVGSRLSPADVRRMAESGDDPWSFVDEVLASASSPPSESLLERVVPTLLEAWNAAPHAKPPAVEAESRGVQCPCGSGRPFLDCCVGAVRH